MNALHKHTDVGIGKVKSTAAGHKHRMGEDKITKEVGEARVGCAAGKNGI